jgi:hypothetical protein
MSESVIKPLRCITRDEYLKWQWVDCTKLNDPERMLVRCLQRTPSELSKAEADWSTFSSRVGSGCTTPGVRLGGPFEKTTRLFHSRVWPPLPTAEYPQAYREGT